MKHKFLRMNQQQKDVCPAGYVWVRNVNTTEDSFILHTMGISVHGIFQVTKDDLRKTYGDVQVVTPAYTNAGIELKDGSVALYVPHQGLRRIQQWLRNHDKMKNGNLPY